MRTALSFSKKLANHVGAITMFICNDNLTKAAAENEHSMDITTKYSATPLRRFLLKAICMVQARVYRVRLQRPASGTERSSKGH